jgi:hypothetical protein
MYAAGVYALNFSHKLLRSDEPPTAPAQYHSLRAAQRPRNRRAKRRGEINPTMDLHKAPLRKYSLLFDQLNLARQAEAHRAAPMDGLPPSCASRD